MPVAMFNLEIQRKNERPFLGKGLAIHAVHRYPLYSRFCTSLSNMDGDINLPDSRLRRNRGAEMGETVYPTPISVLLLSKFR